MVDNEAFPVWMAKAWGKLAVGLTAKRPADQ
jgi:hypothetical protein